MKFPAGTDGGTLTGSLDENIARRMPAFAGAIEIHTGSGDGLLLAEGGVLVAACFRSGGEMYRGKTALSRMFQIAAGTDDRSLKLRVYTQAEFSRAREIAGSSDLLIGQGISQGQEHGTHNERMPDNPGLPVDRWLRKIREQPGVIAVSAFFEGFPVQSLGDEDFEHIAASAEDFMRAGMKIAGEMGIGSLDQLILETETSKLIIAPCGDLFLCIVTESEARLGLIRVVLKSIQQESAG